MYEHSFDYLTQSQCRCALTLSRCTVRPEMDRRREQMRMEQLKGDMLRSCTDFRFDLRCCEFARSLLGSDFSFSPRQASKAGYQCGNRSLCFNLAVDCLDSSAGVNPTSGHASSAW